MVAALPKDSRKFALSVSYTWGQVGAIKKYKTNYEAAKAANPKRWSGSTLNWDPPEEVWLNPEKASSDLEVAAQMNTTTMLTNGDSETMQWLTWKQSAEQLVYVAMI